ncbi:phage portal protein [uncultured Slackia sp.]|uniref:phage portal protein n=1 Tax=uncultured Slackia sp. TaxID=665903 RepID=UPI0026DF8653|nr:phage portal protein [uncultured Slackia sp.]
MVELHDIDKAAGLAPADAAVLSQLLSVFKDRAQRNGLLAKYYEAKQPTPSIGVDNIPENVQVGARCDWASKAVTSVSERVRMDGFGFAGDYRDPVLEEVERSCRLSASFNRHVASELVHGCMFVTVQRGGSGVAVRTHTAETAAAIWDEAEQRIGAGFVIADARRTKWSPTNPVPVQVNMHLPGRVVVLTQAAPAKWTARTLPTPLDRPMMEAFCFRPTGGKPFGQSRITPTVRYLVDEVERTMRYMAVSGALYATPKDVLLGLTDQQFKAMSEAKWSVMVGSLFMGTRDKNGQSPDYRRIQSASPQPYIDSIQTYAKLFSGATGVPLNSLGIVQDNPASAEAIAAQREDICVAAEDCIESNREAMRNVALMAMAVGNNTTLDGLTDEQLSVVPNFKNPMRPSLAATADAMVKVASVMDGFAQTREFLANMGFTPTEVESVRSQLDADANRRALTAIMGGQEPGGGKAAGGPQKGDAPTEVKGKALNGAQTQSLIAIMSQFSSGAITEGQAANLISAAIGMSRADAVALLNGDMGE